ncbi:MAG: DUF819 family protein [Bacteroidetes bacterium]|nr:DUF819 family protein [Bacteroidota bacterium]
MIFNEIFHLLVLLGFPALAYRLQKASGKSWLSPVLLCYAVGILLANLPGLEQPLAVIEPLRDASILLGIPLLLFGTHLTAFLKQARNTLVGFGLVVLSGIISSLIMSLLFSNSIANISIYGGMLTGVYTGGIPNMNLVGMALNAPEEAFIYLNSADIITGGIFLLILLSVGKKVYGLFLTEKDNSYSDIEFDLEQSGKWPGIVPLLKSLLLGVFATGMAVGLTWLIKGNLESVALLLLLLTSVSLLFSFLPKVRSMKASYPAGEYLLLIFSIAIGMMADFSNFESQGLPILLFTGAVLFTAAIIHLFLSRLFKIDRDTTIITATAAFYGPPFVPQVAAAIQKPGLIFPGILCGLAGFAIGNYLGISIGSLLKYLL